MKMSLKEPPSAFHADHALWFSSSKLLRGLAALLSFAHGHMATLMVMVWGTRPRRRKAKGQTKYRIGEIMKHRQYGYRGVVWGWDERCAASEEWIEEMGVDKLEGPHPLLPGSNVFHGFPSASSACDCRACEGAV